MAEVATRLKMGFIIVGCMYTCVYIYGLYYDQFMSCLDPQARWVQLAMVDVYINLLVIGAWIFYKEDFILVKKPIAAFVIFITGSIAICAYVVRQFSKLSPEDSSKDPLYFVLARRQKANDTKHRSYSPATLRAFFGALISFMFGYYIYTYIVDGSPFRKEVLTMCMVGTIADLYVIKGVISVWVAYKESSWISAFMWMLILACFGSIGTCAYLVVQLSYISPHQHVSSVLFMNNNSDMPESDPLLTRGKKLM
ncbi:hypothetical protein Hdeb2414_s0002g00074761 [Helianthus debilis subsp. tardiflorus]